LRMEVIEERERGGTEFIELLVGFIELLATLRELLVPFSHSFLLMIDLNISNNFNRG
jgi:hypothetical protein